MEDWGEGDGGYRRHGAISGAQGYSAVSGRRTIISNTYGSSRRTGLGARERAFAAFESVVNRPLTQLESQALTAALSAFQNPTATLSSSDQNANLQPPGLQLNSLNLRANTQRKGAPQHGSTPVFPTLSQSQALAPNAKRPDQPWRASDVSAVESTVRKVHGILNKLTYSRFDTLSEQLVSSGVDSNKENLEITIELIFDKALSEPQFAGLYTELCAKLNTQLKPLKGPKGEELTFRKLLLARCREKFVQKTKIEGATPEETQALRSQERRRVLGNAIFVGELFKKSLISEKVMHQNVQLLLTDATKQMDEEAMESLAKLLSVVGKALDRPEARSWMDVYFQKIKDFSVDPEVSSRIRFVLVDLLELRENAWTPRRQDPGPRRLEDLHAEEESRTTPTSYSRQANGPPTLILAQGSHHTGVLYKRERPYWHTSHGAHSSHNHNEYHSSRGPSYTLVPAQHRQPSPDDARARAVMRIDGVWMDWLASQEQQEVLSPLENENKNLVVYRAAFIAIQRKVSDRESLAVAISLLLESGKLTTSQVESGVMTLCSDVHRVESDLDQPLLAQSLGDFMACTCFAGAIGLSSVALLVREVHPSRRARVLITALSTYKVLLRDEESFNKMCNATGVDFPQCLVGVMPAAEIVGLFRAEKLMILLPDGGRKMELNEVAANAMNDPAKLIAWVRQHMPLDANDGTGKVAFAELVINVLLNASMHRGTDDNESWTSVQTYIEKTAPAFRFAVGDSVELQLKCLFESQRIWHSVEYPAGLLTSLFKVLHNVNVVSTQALKAWQEEKQDSTPGKAEALGQVRGFLARISGGHNNAD
eukprot:CAMPEP_0184738478 /NCGR_PEP_ID=MMETSP0315-20130426/1094_1 /TAXON_ID=101924 /ORGANISM="Rhodosorus marinus, Strain UTEX LB 2760" /LENGTH=822 /DNA_ID=CAMNT_0027206177 /DNA_START=228 /DNA_END=2696 /DNA_ORIENTATION=-